MWIPTNCWKSLLFPCGSARRSWIPGFGSAPRSTGQTRDRNFRILIQLKPHQRLTPRQTLWTILGADVLLIGLNAFLSMYVNVNVIIALDFVLYLTAVMVLTKIIVKKRADEKAGCV